MTSPSSETIAKALTSSSPFEERISCLASSRVGLRLQMRFTVRRDRNRLPPRRPRSGPEYVDCGVGIGISRMPAIGTLKHRLALAVVFGNRTTIRAHLARVRGIDLDQRATIRGDLVGKHRLELMPASFQDRSVQPCLLADLHARLLGRASRRRRHVPHPKRFKADDPKGARQTRRLNVVEMLAHPRQLGTILCHARLGDRPSVRVLFATRQGSCGGADFPIQFRDPLFREASEGAVRVGKRLDDTAVNANGRTKIAPDLHVHLSGKAHVPSERVIADRGVFDLPWNVAGPSEADLSNLRQFDKPPRLVEAAECHLPTLESEAFVDALLAEGWIVRDAREEVLEGAVRVSQRLLLASLCNTSDPVELGTELRQFGRLTGIRDMLADRPMELAVMVTALFDGEVVDQSTDADMLFHCRLLGGRWTEKEPEPAVDLHASTVTKTDREQQVPREQQSIRARTLLQGDKP